MTENILSEIKDEVNNILPSVIQIRHKLHQYPEIGLKEFKTSKYIREILKPLDIDILPPFLETDVVAIANKNKTAKNITLRADIDALPQQEENDFPYKSKIDGMMHACGHDGHTAILLGTAMVISKLKKHLNGSIRFVFQPGEEVVAGGKKLIDAGVLKNPEPDAVFAMHGWHGIPEGSFSSRPGPITAAVDVFKITVKGKGGHAAYPEKSIDPILISSKIVDSLNHIVSRNLSISEPAVISVCKFNSGRETNIIPNTAILEGAARYFNPELSKKIPKLMEQIINGICDSAGAKFDFSYKKPYIPTIVDKNMLNLGKDTVINIFGKDKWIDAIEPEMVGEDFSYYTQNYPGALFKIGLGEKQPILHSSYFDFNDNTLKNGILFFSSLAFNFLK